MWLVALLITLACSATPSQSALDSNIANRATSPTVHCHSAAHAGHSTSIDSQFGEAYVPVACVHTHQIDTFMGSSSVHHDYDQ